MEEQAAHARRTPLGPPPAGMTLGTYLWRARERAGLSLRNLEAITGITKSTLNRLEQDQVDNPNPDVLHRLADTLELDTDDLFAFVGYRPSDKLPSLAPYLRAKYRLSPETAKEAHEAIQAILERYDEAHDDRQQSNAGTGRKSTKTTTNDERRG